MGTFGFDGRRAWVSRFAALCLVVGGALVTSAARADWAPLKPGVDFLERTDPGPKRIRAVRVDLCQPGVQMRVTASGERGQRPSAWGAAVGATAAINGGFFNPSNPRQYDSTLRGITYNAGNRWPDAQDSARQGYVAFGVRRSVLFSEGLAPPSESWFEEAVNGGVPILVAGAIQGDDALLPRTAVGLSEDRRYAFLVVVDGRSASSVGITRTELANLLLSFGAHDAMNMDGGGSTAMWVAGRGLVNSPSDGTERRTLNQLGVIVGEAGPLPGRHCPWTYGAELVSGGFGPAEARSPTITLAPGETEEVTFEFRNTGQAPWAPDVTRLVTTEPRLSASVLAADSWLAPEQPATVDGPVAPGETGQFTFTVRAPMEPGVYRQHFGLMQVFYAWFAESAGPADNQVFVEVTVAEGADERGAPDGPAQGRGLEGGCSVRGAGDGARLRGRVTAAWAVCLSAGFVAWRARRRRSA